MQLILSQSVYYAMLLPMEFLAQVGSFCDIFA